MKRRSRVCVVVVDNTLVGLRDERNEEIAHNHVVEYLKGIQVEIPEELDDKALIVHCHCREGVKYGARIEKGEEHFARRVECLEALHVRRENGRAENGECAKDDRYADAKAQTVFVLV